MEAIEARVYQLGATLRNKLAQVDGVTVTDGGVQPCGIVTFMTEQLEPDPIAEAMKQFRINVSVSEESGNLVSYLQRNIPGVVRASLHYYNTDAEIDYFIDSLKKVLAG
jgi:cysteine desulfurase / selenocysteine lyase